MNTARVALALLMAAQTAVVPASAQGAPRVVGAVVAVVDGEPITLLQARRRIDPTLRALRATSKAWEWPEAARRILREAVEREIEARLFAAVARSKGITVDRMRIDVALDQVASESHRSRDQYVAELHAAGWSEAALREELRLQILEWDVLRRTFSETHDGPVPTGADWLDWRKRWLTERKAAACIELRIPDGG